MADVAFAASGDSLSGLFQACAEALTAVMVDRRTLRTRVTRELKLKADDSDGLLYDFLTSVIGLKDTDSLLFREFIVDVKKDGKTLTCTMMGEPIDRERNALRNDVKAVTMHLFGIKRGKSGSWLTTVVLDI